MGHNGTEAMSRGLALALLTAVATAIIGAFSIIIVNVTGTSSQVSEIAGSIPHLIRRLDRHDERLDRIEQRGIRHE